MATTTITEEAETRCVSETSKSLRLQVKHQESDGDSNTDHGATARMGQAAEGPKVCFTLEERSDSPAEMQENIVQSDTKTKNMKNKNRFLRKSKSAHLFKVESEANKMKQKHYSHDDTLSKDGQINVIQKQHSTPDIDGPTHSIAERMSNMHINENEEAFVCSEVHTPPSLVCSMSSETSNASSIGSPVEDGDMGDASQESEPQEKGGIKDIIIMHSEDDMDNACMLKDHLLEYLKTVRPMPSIGLPDDRGFGQTFIGNLERYSDEFRLILVYPETIGGDIFFKQSVEMLQADGLINRSTPDNEWHKLIPVLPRKNLKLPFAWSHLKPLKYWIYLEGQDRLLQSYKESLENMLKRARKEYP